MKIVLAPDSFKECLSASEVARALAQGCRRAAPHAEVDLVPIADGGEGTVDALVTATGGRFIVAPTHDPLGHPIEARFGLLGDGRTAVVEVAAASGLPLVPATQRHPGFTSSYGTGELILHALSRGASTVIVGLGGSATNDAGAGIAQALGFSLRDRDDRELPFGGFALSALDWIDDLKVRENVKYAEFIAAFDVDSPLCGPQGASYVFGPQKGGNPKTCEMLDAALTHFRSYIREQYAVDIGELPGAGAAGGIGAGLTFFCRAKLRRGFEVVAQACRLEERLHGAELAITGEGQFDRQSLSGKAPIGVAALASAAGVPCWVVSGAREVGIEAELPSRGIQGSVALSDLAGSAAESLRDPVRYLADAAERIVREARA